MPRAVAKATDRKPDEFLSLHGYKVSSVVSVWSGAESDFGYETILYLDDAGQPRTAVIVNGKLVCRPGWDWFDIESYLPG